MSNTSLTVSALIQAPVEKVWECWTSPGHIVQWNNASEDWHTPSAINELFPGGKLNWRMEAKDGSFGFDFEGVYNEIKTHRLISYTIADGRKVQLHFESKGTETLLTETFEPENMNSHELQLAGWQAILNNFKKHTESQ